MRHILYRVVVMIAFCVSLASVSLSSDSNATNVIQRHNRAAVLAQLKKLAKSDPAEDFAAAEKKGDITLFAIMGYAKVVPGVPEYDKKYAKYIGTKLIPGTTDAITSREQGKVLDDVQTYAEKYNKLVIAYFEKHRRKDKAVQE